MTGEVVKQDASVKGNRMMPDISQFPLHPDHPSSPCSLTKKAYLCRWYQGVPVDSTFRNPVGDQRRKENEIKVFIPLTSNSFGCFGLTMSITTVSIKEG